MSNMQSSIKFIACADLHLRDTVPENRIDDYWSAQEEKLNFLIDAAIKNKCNILCAGDFFHKAKSSAYLEAWTIQQLKKLTEKNLKFIVIPGQHDLPNHSSKEIDKSSIHVLQQAGIIDLHVVSYEQKYILEKYNAMLLHAMIHKDQAIHKDIKSTKASSLLKKAKDIKYIITGDNHQPFMVEREDKTLVNCGSMMRMTSDQIDYKPRFYLISKNTVKEIFYPIKEKVMSIENIEKEKERKQRTNLFVEKINSKYEIELSFQKNLENFFRKNKIRKGVQKKCWEVVDE